MKVEPVELPLEPVSDHDRGCIGLTGPNTTRDGIPRRSPAKEGVGAKGAGGAGAGRGSRWVEQGPRSGSLDRASRATHDLPALVDITTIAGALGVTVRHVRRLVADRRIPFVRVGHFIRFDIDEVKRWLDEHRVTV